MSIKRGGRGGMDEVTGIAYLVVCGFLGRLGRRV